MNDNIDSIAITLGAIITVVAVFGALALYWTHYKPPRERRALRLGMVVALLSAASVLLGEVALYRHFPTAGLFMAIPTMPLTILALIFGGYWAYRALGGGQPPQTASGSPAAIEPQTREQQGAIWCRLRDLPHFRETVGGDLINLATGDCVHWIDYRGDRCIEIKLGGKTAIAGSRYETLTKYLAVQTGLARVLLGQTEGLVVSNTPASP